MTEAAKARFVVAFNRDRDFYQVPLALEEAGALERLITDFYLPDALAGNGLARRFGAAHRRAEGLTSRRVEGSWQALRLQLFALRRARTEPEKTEIFLRLDRGLSERSLAVARSSGADFFAYTGYALEAFAAADSAVRRKVLFVYHPQAALSEEILRADAGLHPEMSWSHQAHLKEMESSEAARVGEEICLADELVCASSFTRRSIERVIGATKPVAVVPYGCPTIGAAAAKPSATDHQPRVLFVGQGVQRKGLHHLLEVWKRRSAWGASLTIVASRLDPGAGKLAAAAGAPVTLLPAQARAELQRLFDEADVFVMPSLVEGFGLVYLEALAAGCFVIGTENTGVPDLRAPADVAAAIPAGDLDKLEAVLERSIAAARRGDLSPEAIRDFARTRNWEQFRAGIRAAVGISTP